MTTSMRFIEPEMRRDLQALLSKRPDRALVFGLRAGKKSFICSCAVKELDSVAREIVRIGCSRAVSLSLSESGALVCTELPKI